jgi:DNA gyrase subunit A
MIAIQVSERNGNLVGAILVDDTDEVMLISTGGVLIRTKVAQIREQGRTTQGVTLIALGEGEKLAGLERVVERDEEIGNGNGEAAGDTPAEGSQDPDGSGTPPAGGTGAQ